MNLESAIGTFALNLEGDSFGVESISSYGRTRLLRGSEFRILGRGDRIQIPGWRLAALQGDAVSLDEAFAQAERGGWEEAATPVFSSLWPTSMIAVSSVKVPAQPRSTPVELVLGGWETFSWSQFTVYISGVKVGVRSHPRNTWSEPLRVVLDESFFSEAHLTTLEIVLILEEPWAASFKLDEVDPGQQLLSPKREYWPAQFEQYLEVGAPTDWMTPEVLSATEVSNEDGLGAHVLLQFGKQLVDLNYTWAWGGRCVMRSAMAMPQASHPPLAAAAIDHGTWQVASSLGDRGGPGLAVGADDIFVRSLVNPAGWAIGTNTEIALRQFTADGHVGRLHTAATFFSKPGESADEVIHDYLDVHNRRRTKDPDLKLVFSVDGFGSWSQRPNDSPYSAILDERPKEEDFRKSFDSARRLAEAGVNIDFFSIDFWTGTDGPYAVADESRIPSGLAGLIKEVERIPAVPGVWLDYQKALWSLGTNPEMVPTSLNAPVEYPVNNQGLCLASEPYQRTVIAGIRRILTQGVRFIKLDSYQARCNSQNHGHLPGVHALEAVTQAALDMLTLLGDEFPDANFVLYWGWRSPWWALSGSLIFDPGFTTEAAHPFSRPARSLRASTVHSVNASLLTNPSIPAYCKDTLGVWLSDWQWNSAQGIDDWRIAFAVDLVRTNRFPQLWLGEKELSDDDIRWLSTVLELARTNSSALSNFKILGDPLASDTSPYALECSDGTNGLLAVHNPGWVDHEFEIPAATSSLIDRGCRVIAGSGVSKGPKTDCLRVGAQGLAVLAIGEFADGLELGALLNRDFKESEFLWNANQQGQDEGFQFDLPDFDCDEEHELAVLVEVRNSAGEPIPIARPARIAQIADASGKTPETMTTVVGNSWPSSWQVFVVASAIERLRVIVPADVAQNNTIHMSMIRLPRHKEIC